MDIRQKVLDLVKLVEEGRMLEALAAHYADDVSMQENLSEPTVGLKANLEREEAFFGSLRSARFHAASVVVDGDRATINWIFDYTTDDGRRWRMDEVAVQTWSGGKMIRERFVYDTATLAAA